MNALYALGELAGAALCVAVLVYLYATAHRADDLPDDLGGDEPQRGWGKRGRGGAP